MLVHQSKLLDVCGLEDLGLDASTLESPLRWTNMTTPESEGDATLYEGSPEDTAGELATVLRDLGVGQ